MSSSVNKIVQNSNLQLSSYKGSKLDYLMFTHFFKILMNKNKKRKAEDRVYKVVTLGEGRVGKTSIITRYVKDSFSDKTEETSDGYCTEKQIKTQNGLVDLAIWVCVMTIPQDTAGQEKYHSMAPLFYRNSDAAMIVYDITVKETLQKASRWIQELKQFSQNDKLLLVLVGNKCDMHI